nr:Fe-S cluster assembly protein SufD [Saprospiraceae bacterium]
MLPKYQTEVPQHFKALFDQLGRQLNGQKDHHFQELRIKGGKNLFDMGFPTTRNEDYKYTALGRVFNKEYQLPDPKQPGPEMMEELRGLFNSEMDSHRICFYNGQLVSELTEVNEKGIGFFRLSDLSDEDLLNGEVLKHMDHTLSQTNNPFLHLNTALCREPLVLVVDKDHRASKPIQVVYHYSANDSDLIANPQFFVIARENSKFSMIEKHTSNPSDREVAVFANVFQRWITEKNANVDHTKIQELSENDFIIHNLIASQEAHSHFYALTADLGSRITRNNLEVHLLDSHTQTDMFGLFIGNANQHIDNQTFLDHAVPHCESREWYKGVLSGKSRGVFNGKVLVRQDAQKTNAFQQNNTLLSSDHARMDSKPQLEIYADDVKCSHGATIGQMDDQILFYLKSRGLDDDQAGELVKVAFLAEVFNSMDEGAIKNTLAGKVLDKLREIQ